VEATGPNIVKVPIDEQLFELITLIKPTHRDEGCSFLEGPLWAAAKRTYNEKLVNRTYHLPNHHLYRLQKVEGSRVKSTYWRVSGRGNLNLVTKEEAIEVIGQRSGYVDDYDLMNFGPKTDPDPAIPYTTPNCDF
jgi:hypothetical protein